MKSRSRELRSESSIPERRLWAQLRSRRLDGLKFRRQVPIGPYVADFACEAARLIVELDGESHTGTGDADARRTAFLESQGWRVIRVTIDDFLNCPDAVLEFIHTAADTEVQGRSALTPNPSPEGRGGPDD